MEKNISLPAASKPRFQDIRHLMGRIAQVINTPIALLQRYYSSVLDKEISGHQTRLLLKVQCAFVLAGFPMESPFLLRIVCVAWFVQALLACRRSLA